MFDHIFEEFGQLNTETSAQLPVSGSRFFWMSKRGFDIFGSLLLMPVLIVVVVVLLLLNPFWNRGRLYYVQSRMGKNCKPFNAIKFRSMTSVEAILRGPDDPIEDHRITRLGRFLRKSRLDELPQILNVFAGHMSLIGPRPDYFLHAESYAKSIPGYQERHQVRPGISGLAQVQLGYAAGMDATRSKVNADHIYLQNAGFVLETQIVAKTIVTVLSRAGA